MFYLILILFNQAYKQGRGDCEKNIEECDCYQGNSDPKHIKGYQNLVTSHKLQLLGMRI